MTRKKYGALAFDTNVIKTKGFDFLKSPLKELSQFKGSEIKVILPKIIEQEILKHLRDSNSYKKLESFKECIKKIIPYHPEFGNIKFPENIDILVLAKDRLNQFVKSVGIEILSSEGVSVTELEKLYFEKKPPFSEGKKEEFPDAIALLTLRKWSEKNNHQKILAVSEDNDWKNFAKEQDWLEVEKDFSSVIEKLLKQQGESKCKSLFIQFWKENYDREDIREKLESSLEDVLFVTDPSAENGDRVEAEITDFSVIEILEPDEIEAYLIEEKGEIFTVQTKISAELSFSAVVDFYFWDSVDKEEICVGSQEEEHEETIYISIFLECKLDNDGELEIQKISVEQQDIWIDFGSVSLDYF